MLCFRWVDGEWGIQRGALRATSSASYRWPIRTQKRYAPPNHVAYQNGVYTAGIIIKTRLDNACFVAVPTPRTPDGDT